MIKLWMLFMSILVIIAAALNIPLFTYSGFWLLAGFFILAALTIRLSKRLFWLFEICFFTTVLVLGIITTLRNDICLLSFIFILLGLIGWLSIMASPKNKKSFEYDIIDKSEILDKEIPNEKSPEIEITDKGEEFVASKNGTIYHTLTCPITKRISLDNRIVVSKKEAQYRGLKPHSCVKH